MSLLDFHFRLVQVALFWVSCRGAGEKLLGLDVSKGIGKVLV